MQLPLWSPSSAWRPPNLSELPSWAEAGRVGLDLETRDPLLTKLGPGPRRGGYITGFSMALEDGGSWYVPIDHAGGDNVDRDQALNYLRDQAKSFTGIVAGANLSYDLDFLGELGILFPKVKFFRDVLLAEPLICELYNSYSLQSTAERHGFAGKDEAVLRAAAAAYGIDPKSEMWQLPARFVGAYAQEDARLPLDILRRQERIIEEQELWRVFDLESRVMPILSGMRRRGVRIDLDRLAAIEQWTMQQESEALAQIHAATGHRIAVGDVWKPETLAPALEFIGVKVPRTSGKKPKPSIDKFLLAGIDHPVARAMEQARKVNKLRTTFAQSIRDHMTNGRIHCTFNQLRKQKDEDADGEDNELGGAAYGRLSSEHPNMQQQPARDDVAKMWRQIYLPEEGEQWASLDYSQQEPRMVVHFAVLARRQIGSDAHDRAVAAAEKYRNDPTTDNHQMMADMAGIKRKAAKEIFLGLCYGMGGAKLCMKLGLPTMMGVWGQGALYAADSPEGRELIAQGKRAFRCAGPEGQQLLDKFDAEVPFVKRLAKACETVARKNGFIRTLSGRRCRFPTDENGNFDWVHKGLNRLIQGSSADQTKEAMVALDAAGYGERLLLQVHDEMDTSVTSQAMADDMAHIMATCTPLQVPSKVDVEVGASWGESMG